MQTHLNSTANHFLPKYNQKNFIRKNNLNKKNNTDLKSENVFFGPNLTTTNIKGTFSISNSENKSK